MTTIREWLAMADQTLKGVPGMRGDVTWEGTAAWAQAYIARAQLAAQLAERAGHTVKDLEQLLKCNHYGVLRVVPTPDGMGLVVALTSLGRYDTEPKGDTRKIWDATQPWRAAGWEVHLTVAGVSRCGAAGNAIDRHSYEFKEEPGPWCEYCGHVGGKQETPR